MSDKDKKIGIFLKELRKSRKFTLRELNYATGFSIGVLSRMENGYYPVNSVILKRYKNFFTGLTDYEQNKLDILLETQEKVENLQKDLLDEIFLFLYRKRTEVKSPEFDELFNFIDEL
jgi:transcriptional regulator with XRE-family HTH domain